MSENDRKFKVEFTLGKVKSWKMSQKKSENFRNIRALLHAHAHESAFSIMLTFFSRDIVNIRGA